MSKVWVLILVPLVNVCVALVDLLNALLNDPDGRSLCVNSISEIKRRSMITIIHHRKNYYRLLLYRKSSSWENIARGIKKINKNIGQPRDAHGKSMESENKDQHFNR